MGRRGAAEAEVPGAHPGALPGEEVWPGRHEAEQEAGEVRRLPCLAGEAVVVVAQQNCRWMPRELEVRQCQKLHHCPPRRRTAHQ